MTRRERFVLLVGTILRQWRLGHFAAAETGELLGRLPECRPKQPPHRSPEHRASPASDRLAKARATEIELRTSRAAGRMVDAGQVEAEWSNICATIRARLALVSRRVAGRHPTLDRIVIADIESEVREALAELADAG